MRIPAILFVASVLAGCSGTALAIPQNLFEWMATAPLVLVGENVAADGPYVQIQVDEVLRGPVPDGRVVRVNIKRANRYRDRELQRPVHLEVGISYVLLLTEAPRKKPTKYPTFDLVRGVDGVRELPPEGVDVLLDALRRFARIHELGDDRLAWDQFETMLEETHPLLLQVALEQFLKFQRGDVSLLATIRPLLDHPAPDLRELAAQLVKQILTRSRWRDEPIPDRDVLAQDLTALARRDGSVPVRVAATYALIALGGDTVWEVIEQIADDDPDQRVRYAAERLLYEHSVEEARAKRPDDGT